MGILDIEDELVVNLLTRKVSISAYTEKVTEYSSHEAMYVYKKIQSIYIVDKKK